ncbi:NAD(P)/FAD-dependent oxidoreductase [Streptomyces lavendofoliae]|uniref:Pyridine nucleotide-disulfide oxidoreductase n=1 Tax=Streptomyces lavendofoliae TaxID=67314 RepID=A0A918M6I2_9ACTN|nr:FAD-dependent oxidoreductase [Streptomyces lavendofoliae]GGU59487.1 pyridine nucleotide-disulfide oxidoreductase [Streptomyces lavendofoliae]
MGPRGVVVIGAGQGGLDTAAALRARGYRGRITLVGDEPVLPYQRPPLSKGFLTGDTSGADLELRPRAFFAAQDIDLVSGTRAARIDRERRTVLLETGATLPYDSLVLATGARPRTLPVPGAGSLSGVLTLRGLADAEGLRKRLTGPPRRLVVVGAGFIGLEVAATARKLGHEVTVVEAQSRALARALTPAMSSRLVAEHLGAGVRVLLGREVTALWGSAAGRVEVVELDGAERVAADLVVVGIGVLPNTELASLAELQVGDGIVVDAHLRTDDPDVYALGDCARFPSPHAGRHIRLESVQNASDQAKVVAAGICGDRVPYTAVPWFWSEQYGLRLQIAGLTAGHDETVTTGDPDGGRFSVFCFRRGRLTGVESVNRPADHGIARRLLASGTELTADEVRQPGFDLKTHARRPQERLSHA